MGYKIEKAKCPECGIFLLDTGNFLECDECGHVEGITNDRIIESIKKEYPEAVIFETDDEIVVDIQITLKKPVEKIQISGVVNR